MTESNRRIYLKALTESSLDDELLNLYLDMADDAIRARAYPFDAPEVQRELPERYQRLGCEIAAYLIAKRGAEGQTAHSENGISRTYESAGIPASYLRQIVPECGVPQ